MRPHLFILAIVTVAIAGLGALFAPTGDTASALPQTCGPYVDLTPGYGKPGDVISVNVFNYPPNIEVTVTARVTGEPVVGKGTTDGQGHVNVLITVPAFSGSYMNIFVYAPPCNAAGAHLFFRDTTPTPTNTPKTSTPTPTTPTTVTPPPTVVIVTPPPSSPPPSPPIAGSGGGSGFVTGNARFDIALVVLALVAFTSASTLLGTTMRKPVRAATGNPEQPRDETDYNDRPPTFS